VTGGVVPAAVMAALVLVPAWFVVTSWSRGRFRTRDRLAAVVGAVEAGAATLLFQHVATASVTVPLALWVTAVLLLAAGVVGIALRWAQLPGLRGGAKRRTRTAGAVVALAVSAAVVVLVLLSR
jgi:hypothetical protein